MSSFFSSSSQRCSTDFLCLNSVVLIKSLFDRFKVLERFGTSGAALNLSNDYAVYRFLDGEIKFTDIPIINQSVLQKHPWNEDPSLTDLSELDDWVKEFVTNY